VRRSALFFITAPLAFLYGCAQIAGLDDFVDMEVSAQSASAAASSSSSSSQGAGGATGSGGGSSSNAGGSGSGGAGGGGGTGGSGGCEPIGGVVPIACGQIQPSAITTSFEGLFWTNEASGEIIALTKIGEPLDRIVDNEVQPCGLVVRGGYLYFRTRGGSVKRKSLGGGNLEVIATNQGDSCAIDADGQFVYWFKIGGGPAELIKGQFNVAPMPLAQAKKPTRLSAADATFVYWIDAMDFKLFQADKTMGGGPSDFTRTGDLCDVAAATDGFAYSTDKGMGLILRDKAMEASGPGIAAGQSTPCSIAVSLPGVYWINKGNGSIARTESSATPQMAPTVLASGQDGACAITADGAYVYWTDCVKGAVLRVAHP
jgi:hypothetical protein